MKNINLVFPNHLFEHSPLLNEPGYFVLLEEHLFFKQYPFHKIKIAYHRATMKAYQEFLHHAHKKTKYISAAESESDIRTFITQLPNSVETIRCVFPTDFWLEKRLEKSCNQKGIELIYVDENPLFLNSKKDNEHFFKPTKKKFLQATFYKQQRKRYDILLDQSGEPKGGKWSFDEENRKKYPRKKVAPTFTFPKKNDHVEEAFSYVETHFSTNYGILPDDWFYPINFSESDAWLTQFLEHRFEEFGDYEDAIVAGDNFLNHSVLTPMLNVGLLTPKRILEKTQDYALNHNVRLNSYEGFVRQIIGWREFIRGIYEVKGVQERTTNFFGFTRRMPKSFYTGNTGIEPIDTTIKKVLQTGYCHHIERLMILSNFMLLCEIDPDEVYQWFMELFVDAYDWVMVPNVYGMGQFADGGILSTKPYISSSNYVKKMSDYGKADWNQTWDALFWRFMSVHRDFLENNARMGLLYKSWDKKTADERDEVITRAEDFLAGL